MGKIRLFDDMDEDRNLTPSPRCASGSPVVWGYPLSFLALVFLSVRLSWIGQSLEDFHLVRLILPESQARDGKDVSLRFWSSLMHQ